jgi:DNA-binding transcriptional MerR regulator
MFLLVLLKIWDLVKPHLVAIVLTAATLSLGYYFLEREKSGFVDQMKKQQEDHDVMIKKIADAQDLERKQHEENYRNLQTQLDQVKVKYDAQIKALEEKKAAKVASLVNQFDTDPNGMAKNLSDLTGFRLYLPEKK